MNKYYIDKASSENEMKPMPYPTEKHQNSISVLSVNWNCLRFMKLLVQSVRKFTLAEHEIIIVDNDSEDGSKEWLTEQKDIETVQLNHNIRHGPGLDIGMAFVNKKYCLVLDIDSHLQRQEWDKDLIELYESDPDIKLIAAKGGPPDVPNAKPIHACFQFFETEFFRENKLSFKARNGYDVGRMNYYDVVNLGYRVERIPIHYEGSNKKKLYGDVWGDEYCIKGKPFTYHNWYGSRIYKIGTEKADRFYVKDIEEKIENLFRHEKVKEILIFSN